MNHKWITGFKDKEITGTHLFMEKGSTVLWQLQNRFNLFLFLLFEVISMDTPTRQWNIWLHGSVAPTSKDTLEKHTSLHMSLSQWLFVWQWELFIATKQRVYITIHSTASKFSFLWEALFKRIYMYTYIYKQKLVCRQWISSLCDSTGLGPGCFCVLPMLTLAWEKLKLL